MKLKTIKYDYIAVMLEGSNAEEEFKKAISVKNILYFFYNNDECLYIGESGKKLYDRFYKHTPKHHEKEFFKEGNMIHIIELGSEIDDIARQALESSFILAYRPKYNKKA